MDRQKVGLTEEWHRGENDIRYGRTRKNGKIVKGKDRQADRQTGRQEGKKGGKDRRKGRKGSRKGGIRRRKCFTGQCMRLLVENFSNYVSRGFLPGSRTILD